MPDDVGVDEMLDLLTGLWNHGRPSGPCVCGAAKESAWDAHLGWCPWLALAKYFARLDRLVDREVRE